jgi:hypothetical protein
MKFKSSIITTGSGKLGGNVFNKNGTIRAFAMPTVSQSQKSVDQRTLQVAVKNAWKALTLEQQAAWNAQGDNYKKVNAVGDVRTPSGYQIFMGVNGTIQAAARPPFKTGQVVTVPPGRVAPPNLGVTVTMEAGALDIATANAGNTSTYLVIRATPPLGSGRTKARESDYRIIASDLDTTTPGTLDAYDDYVSVFGPIEAGARVGVKVTTVNAGTGEEITNVTSFGIAA